MSLEEHIQREMSAEFSNGTVTTTEDASANSSRLSNIEIDFLDEGDNGYFMNSTEIDFLEERDVEDFMNSSDLLDEIFIGNFLNSTSSKDTTKGTTATAERKQSRKRDQISTTKTIKSVALDTQHLLIFVEMMGGKAIQSIVDWFTRKAHHRNISVLYITQNFFDRSLQHRTISLKAHHLVLFKNPRDKSQITVLSRQYLMVDFSPRTSTNYIWEVESFRL